MQPERETILARARRGAARALAALVLAIFMTWPLAAGIGSLGRTGVGPNADPRFGTNGDGMFSLWNVAWVARTLAADPFNVFQANIFFPHRDTLAYSEANLVAGAAGMPVWWTTKNPYATLNVVILLGFMTSFLFARSLFRYLTRDTYAATVAAVLFAYCPYVFAHTAHIQLMLTGGIPLSLLMLHRLADAPTTRRGLGLGGALLLQALACAYYGVFAALMIGFGVLFLAFSRSLLRNRGWWTAVGIAAAVSIAGVAPFLYPYFEIRQEAGFSRTLQESVRYSANLSSYLSSAAYAHRWLLGLIAGWPKWTEVMFPGFLSIAFAATGAVLAGLGARRHAAPRERETAWLYGSLGVLAFWASFGPAGGFYSILFHIPLFSFLRAPSRLAIVVCFSLAVLAALGVRRLLVRAGAKARILGIILTVAAIGEMTTRMPWERAVAVPGPYDILAKLPKAPIAEFPFYGGRVAWHLHTQYMLFSTTHWMPLMNGYSDYTPIRFRQDAIVLDGFPSNDSFAVLQKARVRYIGVHWDMFGPREDEIRERLQPFRKHLRPMAASPRMTIFEIVSFP